MNILTFQHLLPLVTMDLRESSMGWHTCFACRWHGFKSQRCLIPQRSTKTYLNISYKEIQKVWSAPPTKVTPQGNLCGFCSGVLGLLGLSPSCCPLQLTSPSLPHEWLRTYLPPDMPRLPICHSSFSFFPVNSTPPSNHFFYCCLKKNKQTQTCHLHVNSRAQVPLPRLSSVLHPTPQLS